MRTTKLLVAALSFVSVSAFAASQGDVGETSQGSVNINAKTKNLVRLSGLSDITLNGDNTWAGEGDLTGTSSACVWTNHKENKYSITATGNGDNSAFELSDSSTSTKIAYTVTWEDQNDLSKSLTTGSKQSDFVTTANSTQCNSGNDANTLATLTVTVSEAEMLQAKHGNGNYSGVLTLVVSAE